MPSTGTLATLTKIFAHCAVIVTTKRFGTQCRTICGMWSSALAMKSISRDAVTFAARM
jgi:hypothetical protein